MQLANKKYILSISGGNILTSLGGTEKVIITHQKMFNESGISYVYIYPVTKKIAGVQLYYYWGVVLDGKMVGILETKALLSFLSSIGNGNSLLMKVHIHHLRGIMLDQLSEILDYVRDADIFFYLHDYYLICDSYTLMDSSDRCCGSGVPSQEKCENCAFWKFHGYTEERRKFVLKYLNRMNFIAPSECPAEIIGDSIPEIRSRIRIIYHQKAIGEYTGNLETAPGEPLRVAFCGLPIRVKGWDDFLYASEIATQRGAQVQFYHLGKKDKEYAHIINCPVGFQDGSKTMTKMLRELKIDCVILWSGCPETYSYVYYECYAANTFILANNLSGNIAKQVNKNCNGIVLSGRKELADLLSDSDKLRKLVDKYRNCRLYGPMELIENDQIIGLSMCEGISLQPITFKKFSIKRRIVEKAYLQHLNNK